MFTGPPTIITTATIIMLPTPHSSSSSTTTSSTLLHLDDASYIPLTYRREPPKTSGWMDEEDYEVCSVRVSRVVVVGSHDDDDDDDARLPLPLLLLILLDPLSSITTGGIRRMAGNNAT